MIELIAKVRDGIVPTAEELGQLVDYFKKAEKERLAADKVAAALKEKEVAAKQAIIIGLNGLKIDAIGGANFVVQRSIVKEPIVEDWDVFYQYILKTKDFSLLERRPGKAAIKERWADDQPVPGITSFPVDKLSFTKLKGA